MPWTFRKVSCWPAKEASGRSSAVAEERTAKLAPGWSALRRANCSRTACSSADGNAASITQRRTVAPASASARTSSTSSVRSRLSMRSVSPASRRNSRKAMRRRRKSAGHPDARVRELADHLAEAGVLAANDLDIGHSQLFERDDQGGRQGGLRHGKAP